MAQRYYRRLDPRQQRVYRRSNQIVTLPVPAAAELAEVTQAISKALASGEPRTTAAACARLLRRVCARLGVNAPAVTVLAERPAGRWGELHGLYTPSQGADGTITVWMRTAKRGRIVAFRTFVRTLLHELCHHLDFALLKLAHSFHTKGFYQRESSLYRQLLAARHDADRPHPGT